MNGDALRSSLKYVYYLMLINAPKISGDVILGNKGRYGSVVTEAGTALSISYKTKQNRIDKNYSDF